MSVRMFYKTQRELAGDLNELIDTYWNDTLSEHDLVEGIVKVYINNQDKLLNEQGFTTVISQQCGKRRIEVIRGVLIHKGYEIPETRLGREGFINGK